VPVSRKRKKKSQSGRRSQRQPVTPRPSKVSQANALAELFAHRRELAERRTALAADAAGAVVDALVAVAPMVSDDDLEDDLCRRYGAAMAQFDDGPPEDVVNPEDLAHALLRAIDERLP